MKLAIILGTRPEIIKLAPIVRECEKRGIEFFILHSGQHYSPFMDDVFFEDLELPEPRYQLDIGRMEYRKRVGVALREMERILREEWPDAVIVQGDTFTVLMGCLAAKKLDRPVAHLEAGLRSHDLSMPEEINRIQADHISEYLYPPTKDAQQNLLDEGLVPERSKVFGNTVVDALLQHRDLSKRKSRILDRLKLKDKEYIVLTTHRQENVDVPSRLHGILQGASRAGEQASKRVIFAQHPRTAARIKEFKIKIPAQLEVIEPPGYLDFMQLMESAALLITDSGGIQEETSVLGVPCVTVRDSTERPETIEAGVNILAGTDEKDIAASAKKMLRSTKRVTDLYGKGDASQKMISDLSERIRKRKSVIERSKWILRMTRGFLRRQW